MRRNFYEIINGSSLNMQMEYKRIYNLFYDNAFSQGPIVDIVEDEFEMLPTAIRGRAISLSDFDETYEFDFPTPGISVTADDVISLCEYAWNLCTGVLKYAYHILGAGERDAVDCFLKYIISTIKLLCHTPITKDGITIFVPETQDIIAVSEIVDSEMVVSIMEYHHHTLRGNLAKKKAILKLMADDIEPHRKTLNGINKTLADNLFQMLQKFVRHNNEDNPYIKALSPNELESCYDDIYQMWLLAKLEIDNLERKKRVEAVIKQINTK